MKGTGLHSEGCTDIRAQTSTLKGANLSWLHHYGCKLAFCMGARSRPKGRMLVLWHFGGGGGGTCKLVPLFLTVKANFLKLSGTWMSSKGLHGCYGVYVAVTGSVSRTFSAKIASQGSYCRCALCIIPNKMTMYHNHGSVSQRVTIDRTIIDNNRSSMARGYD